MTDPRHVAKTFALRIKAVDSQAVRAMGCRWIKRGKTVGRNLIWLGTAKGIVRRSGKTVIFSTYANL
jgi:hypothetical protein